jgi:hypothetical protein
MGAIVPAGSDIVNRVIEDHDRSDLRRGAAASASAYEMNGLSVRLATRRREIPGRLKSAPTA